MACTQSQLPRLEISTADALIKMRKLLPGLKSATLSVRVACCNENFDHILEALLFGLEELEGLDRVIVGSDRRFLDVGSSLQERVMKHLRKYVEANGSGWEFRDVVEV